MCFITNSQKNYYNPVYPHITEYDIRILYGTRSVLKKKVTSASLVISTYFHTKANTIKAPASNNAEQMTNNVNVGKVGLLWYPASITCVQKKKCVLR